jgi:hypothetical protein
MEIRYAHATCITRNLRIVPLDRKRNRRVAEHAEVVAIVRVFRNPLARKDKVAPESLLETGVELRDVAACLVFDSA